MGRYGEQEVSWKTIKGRDSEAGSEMERKGHIQLDTMMCLNEGRQWPRWPAVMDRKGKSREIPISDRNPLRWSLWDRLIHGI